MRVVGTGGEDCSADEVDVNEFGGVNERGNQSTRGVVEPFTHSVVLVVGGVVGGRFAKGVKGDKLCCD